MREPKYSLLPTHTAAAMERYLKYGLPPGGFLTACLENNFAETCMRADPINREHLLQIAQFLWWEIPSDAWGSPEKVKAWLAAKREEKQKPDEISKEAV